MKCKQCQIKVTKETSVIVLLKRFCSFECAAKFGKANIPKGKEIRRKERKKEFYENNTRTRSRAAKEWCHKYIKLRDAGQPCICCGRPVQKNQAHAGHFLESGNNSFIRYHEDNIHLQHEQCNMYKGGDSGEYEPRLRDKIGDERVDWLYDNRNNPVKRSASDYKEIENYYRLKIKEIESEKS